MKLLRETVRRIILESGMKTMDDFPFDDTTIVIKRETYGYSIYYADENNPQQPTNHPKGYMEIAAPNGDTGPCGKAYHCLLYTSPSPRDESTSRMPSSA